MDACNELKSYKLGVPQLGNANVLGAIKEHNNKVVPIKYFFIIKKI